ncbi:hypothetical protein [Burkholderia ubonensis]|uniref:hypothetical protein n=1 Tax=Burkholderia ubonensis TaxID=101571 RepID=UPI0039F49BA4
MNFPHQLPTSSAHNILIKFNAPTNQISHFLHYFIVSAAIAIPMLLPDAACAESPAAREKQARMPRLPQDLPPLPEQAEYNLPLSKQDRASLLDSTQSRQSSTRNKRNISGSDCRDMAVIAQHRAAALADYIANLPDYECHYGLFRSIPRWQRRSSVHKTFTRQPAGSFRNCHGTMRAILGWSTC